MKTLLWYIFFSSLLLSCKTEEKRVAYINSYHPGYPPADEVSGSIQSIIDSSGYRLFTRYIDSKRILSEDLLSLIIDSIRKELEDFNPDVIIAADDYAVRNIIKPWYSDENAPPVVFCGVNWSAAEYELKSPLITGILEVLPLHESLGFLKSYYPGAKILAVVSENSLSEHKNTKILDTLFSNTGFVTKYYLADNFEEWKEFFVQANYDADLIYLPTNGSVRGWDEEEAKAFVAGNIRKPVFTCDDFMMPYCVTGFTKVAAEQGEWAAITAIAILKGTKPSEIPVTMNKKSRTWFNPGLAEKIGFNPASEWISKASVYTSE